MSFRVSAGFSFSISGGFTDDVGGVSIRFVSEGLLFLSTTCGFEGVLPVWISGVDASGVLTSL
jgi:hypothetical protein